MYVYIIILLILGLQILLFNPTGKNNKYCKIAFVITIIGLALIAGLRGYSVGHDTSNYANIFHNIGALKFDMLLTQKIYPGMESGYVWLCWIFARISYNFRWFLVVTALFEFAAVGIWIWRNSDKPFISLFVFVCMFYTFFLTGIRQCIAVSILLFSYEDVKNKKLLWFICKVLLASLFHQSALIFIVVYILSYFKKPNKFIIASVVMIPRLFIIREKLFSTLINVFSRYNDFEVLTHGDAVTYTLMLALISIVAIIMMKARPIAKEQHRQEYVFCLNCVLLSIWVMPFVGLNGVFMRVAMYFSCFVCFLIEKIYEQISDYRLRIPVQMLSFGVLIMLFLNEVNGSSYIYTFLN